MHQNTCFILSCFNMSASKWPPLPAVVAAVLLGTAWWGFGGAVECAGWAVLGFVGPHFGLFGATRHGSKNACVFVSMFLVILEPLEA